LNFILWFPVGRSPQSPTTTQTIRINFSISFTELMFVEPQNIKYGFENIELATSKNSSRFGNHRCGSVFNIFMLRNLKYCGSTLFHGCLLAAHPRSPATIQTISAENELNIEIKVRSPNETSESISSVFTFLSLKSCFRFTQKAAIPKITETTTITVIILIKSSVPSSLKNEYMFRKKRITKSMSWINAAFGRGRLGFFIFGVLLVNDPAKKS
jgi:hypothetical protein